MQGYLKTKRRLYSGSKNIPLLEDSYDFYPLVLSYSNMKSEMLEWRKNSAWNIYIHIYIYIYNAGVHKL